MSSQYFGLDRYVRPTDSSSRFCQFCFEQSLALTSKGVPNGRHKWTERDHGVTAPVASNTLSVNVFTAPGKTMVGERPKPFGEALGFDPITSTLIFGEYDAVLVDAMGTVAEAEALADWVALHNRNLETSPKTPQTWRGGQWHARSVMQIWKPAPPVSDFRSAPSPTGAVSKRGLHSVTGGGPGEAPGRLLRFRVIKHGN